MTLREWRRQNPTPRPATVTVLVPVEIRADRPADVVYYETNAGRGKAVAVNPEYKAEALEVGR